jgi:hypothetical protein
MCGEHGNPNLQVPLCPPIFKYNDFDIHEVFFVEYHLNNLSCKLWFDGIKVLVVLSNIIGI